MIKNIEKYVKNVSNTQMDFYLMIFFKIILKTILKNTSQIVYTFSFLK